MSVNDKNSESDAESANLFAEFFKSIYDTDSVNSVHTDEIYESIPMEITMNDVILSIKEMKNSESLGPDGIPVTFLKKSVNSIAIPLLIIFNKSLSSGTIHNLWKINNRTPIFKSGTKSDVQNYRPMTLISSVAKVMDSIVSKYVYKAFQDKISINQHGFVRGPSTITNLALLTNDIFQSFGRRTQSMWVI